MAEFEPTIIAFVCNWCTYTAADLAGTSRLTYPPNVRLIRVMCTGMVDPQYVIKALLEGADGVLVAGCEEGSCHFKDGNYLAKRRVNTTKQLLQEAGLEPERLRMVNVSAASSQKFVEYVCDMVETVAKIGPARNKKTTAKEQTGAI